jgi:excisionase family DNA binding protein
MNPSRKASTENLLTAEQVAELIGLSTETLAQWRSQRKGIPYIKISRNAVRYRRAALDEWLSQRMIPVDPGTSMDRRN